MSNIKNNPCYWDSPCTGCEDCIMEKSTENGEIHYEIHITVDYHPKFEEFCALYDLKVVHIDLGENIPKQLMTSSKETHKKESDNLVKKWAKILSIKMAYYGFNVKRIKIEVSPNHFKALQSVPENYFECHFAIINPDDRLKELFDFLHMSKNLLKKDEGNLQMMTFRDRCDYSFFKDKVDLLKSEFEISGYTLKKTIVEYCLYDSNESLDDEWLKPYKK